VTPEAFQTSSFC